MFFRKKQVSRENRAGLIKMVMASVIVIARGDDEKEILMQMGFVPVGNLEFPR